MPESWVESTGEDLKQTISAAMSQDSSSHTTNDILGEVESKVGVSPSSDVSRHWRQTQKQQITKQHLVSLAILGFRLPGWCFTGTQQDIGFRCQERLCRTHHADDPLCALCQG